MRPTRVNLRVSSSRWPHLHQPPTIIPRPPTQPVTNMARGIEGNEVYTPRQPTLKKSTSALEASKAQQRSIQSFFHKKSPTVTTSSAASLTPPASSNGHPPSSPLAHRDPVSVTGKNKENGLHTPITPAIADRGADDGRCVQEVVGVHVQSSPKRVSSEIAENDLWRTLITVTGEEDSQLR